MVVCELKSDRYKEHFLCWSISGREVTWISPHKCGTNKNPNHIDTMFNYRRDGLLSQLPSEFEYHRRVLQFGQYLIV